MLFRALLTLMLLAGASCASAAPRVRKELRRLSSEEYKALVLGLSTMQAVGSETGKMLFGPKFKTYNEMIVKHAVAVGDPRGDQGHTGPCFMTFHRSFLMELEESLLAIAPALKALPYWDISLDNPGARYHNTDKYIFSKMYAGDMEGDASNGFGVTTGVFAWRQVPKFLASQFPQYTAFFNGSAASGQMRSWTNALTNPLVTRFPAQSLLDAIDAASANGTSLLPFGTLPAVAFSTEFLTNFTGSYSLRYPSADFRRCLDPTQYKTWMEWSYCVDLAIISAAPPEMTAEEKLKYVGPGPGVTALLHVGPHWVIGGLSGSELDGDMFDVATSPNEVLLFALHHANLDRSALTWQAAAAKANASMAWSKVSWGYPATKAEYSTAVEGCFLRDVVNSNAPFNDMFSTPPANATGYTHQEVLHLTRPGAGPYVYDTMLAKRSKKL